MGKNRGLVGSGLTPLVPSREAVGVVATPSGEATQMLAAALRQTTEMLQILLSHGLCGEPGEDEELAQLVAADIDDACETLKAFGFPPPEGIATTPDDTREARQAKPAGDRTQDLDLAANPTREPEQ